jgi:hypothetical protein
MRFRHHRPLAAVWDSEVVPLLKTVPGLRPVAIFDEIRRRHPEIGASVRRTLERRISAWRALNGAEQDLISACVSRTTIGMRTALYFT